MRRYRSVSAAVFVVVVCALVGGLFGRSALVAQDQVPAQYEVFAKALHAVETHYVGETEADRLVYSAITGMLQTLDPHSSFMDPRSYAQMRERQEGRYYGLGISIQVIDGDITVFTVFEGSPAYESGIRRGDVIAKIETEETKGWQTDQAVGKLRGPKGTTVNISIRRSGYEKLIDLQVRRDEVRMPSVTAAVMLDGSTVFHEGEWGHGLRDLVDLDAMLRAFSAEPGFWPNLLARARILNLGRPLYYALDTCQRWLLTPIPDQIIAECPSPPPTWQRPLMRLLFDAGLASVHRSCQGHMSQLTKFVLYVRGHYLRMPWRLLIPHLLHQAKRSEKEADKEKSGERAEKRG